jgi:RNA polymerase sigma factor (sigma-70 family)
MLNYNQSSYTERALSLLEKDIHYLSVSNWGYGMPPEDVRQELRIQLWRKIHLYNPHKKALRTWAQQVMRNRLIDMSRKKKELLDSTERDFITDPERENEELIVFTLIAVQKWQETELFVDCTYE